MVECHNPAASYLNPYYLIQITIRRSLPILLLIKISTENGTGISDKGSPAIGDQLAFIEEGAFNQRYGLSYLDHLCLGN